jgi:DNA-binding PucR family transcriptional regulator
MSPAQTLRKRAVPSRRGELALIRADPQPVSVPAMLAVSRCCKELQRFEEEIAAGMLANLAQDAVVSEGVLDPLGDHLCRRWCGAVVRALLQWIEHGAREEELAIPTAVFALGRAAAEEDVAWAALARAHQIQQGELTTRLAEAVCPVVGTDQAGETAGWIAGAVSRFLLRASTDAQSTYETLWSEARLTTHARRRRLTETILAGNAVDETEASLQLGYRLGRTHLGVILWPAEAGAIGPGDVDAAVVSRVVKEAVGTAPLVVSRDTELWAWIACPPDGATPDLIAAIAAALPLDVRSAFGTPAAGVDGFRHTHEQAGRMRDIVRMHVDPPTTAHFGGDAMLESLLLDDLPAARAFAADVLGRLGEPGQREQRHAIAVFLEHGSSYTAAARQLGLHHNTVAYRVRRAEEILGHPLGENRLRTAAALRIADVILR